MLSTVTIRLKRSMRHRTSGRPNRGFSADACGILVLGWEEGPSREGHSVKNPRGVVLMVVGVLTLTLLSLGGGAVGASTPSPTRPGAPKSFTVVPVNGAIYTRWSSPASDGGSAITGYIVTVTPGPVICKSALATQCLVSGLTNGAKYTVEVQAENKVGVGGVQSMSKITPTTAQNCAYGGSFANLQGCDLAGVNLTGRDLLDADLNGTDLVGAQMSGARLTGAELGGADLLEANLVSVCSGSITGVPSALPSQWSLVGGYLVGPYANLKGADLAGADLADSVLSSSALNDANLTNAVLSNVTSGNITGTPRALPANWSLVDGYLIGAAANLAGADLMDADLAGVTLTDANLVGATVTGATVTGANLGGADLAELTSGYVTGIPDAFPVNWSLEDGYIIGPYATLVDADLSRANLTGVDLDSANLTGANLTDAGLDGASLSSAILTGADLSGVSSGAITGTPWALPAHWMVVDGYLVGPSADLANADLNGADLANADLDGADLDSASLTAADLTGVTWVDTTCPDGTNSENDDNTCIDNLWTADGIAQRDLNTALTNAKSLYQNNNQSFPMSVPMVAILATQEPASSLRQTRRSART